MAASVKVVVRVRPLNQTESDHNSRIIVDVVDDTMLVFDPKPEIIPFSYQSVQRSNKKNRANKGLKFVFNKICGLEATNKDVFETTTKDMLASLMEGYNCSVFVYGATGSGKTFTMIGNKEHPGLTYLTIEQLFCTINELEKQRDFVICVSYVEVYNENVYDLLEDSKTALQLQESTNLGVTIGGLTVKSIKTVHQLLDMLKRGNKKRTQHPTEANAMSSRSHAVFQVHIEMKYKASNQVQKVKLSMIDLAGNERASSTGCVGDRFKEGANINKSLLSLANCIHKLADGSSYIPYRESKLTRLLKDSLGGNCKTVMITTVSPSSNSYEDTYKTLKYAARANKIQLSIKKNIVDAGMSISQYVRINTELTEKVKELETKLALTVDNEPLSQLTILNEDLKKKVQELDEKLSLCGVSSSKEDAAREKEKQEWRRGIMEYAKQHNCIHNELLGLMSTARVLALRHGLRTRAFNHVVDLAHRFSDGAMEQMCTEDICRQEEAARNYTKQVFELDAKIKAASTELEDRNGRLDNFCDQALLAFPELKDLVDKVLMDAKVNFLRARDALLHKVIGLEEQQVNAFHEYITGMKNLLRELYFTLNGYEKVTPALTAEYTELMKIMNAKRISQSDDACISVSLLRFVSNLDVDKPTIQENGLLSDNNTKPWTDIVTNSEDIAEQENREPLTLSAKKRKGTPIKLMNNNTIIINDSLESIDTKKTCSAKKLKRKFKASYDLENMVGLQVRQPINLNSTFDMLKTEPKSTAQPVKRALTDRTNNMQRTGNAMNFNRVPRNVKPVVQRKMPLGPLAAGGAVADAVAGCSRPAAAGGSRPAAAGGSRPAAGFGSSLALYGRPINTNNVQVPRNVKPVVQRKMPLGPLAAGGAVADAVAGCSRPAAAGGSRPAAAGGSRPAAGFGSSLALYGRPINTNNVQEKFVGLKAVRARERVQWHPYKRPRSRTESDVKPETAAGGNENQKE